MKLIKRIIKRILAPNWYAYSYNSAASHIVCAEIPLPEAGEIYKALYPQKGPK